MGFWFNPFFKFEGNQTRKNRLMMGLVYVPDPGEKAKKVKLYIPCNVRIPTKTLTSKKAEMLEEKLKSDEEFKFYPPKKRHFPGRKTSFTVLSLELPYDPLKLKKLSADFQKGNYTKLLRFGGFFPERKVALSKELEEKIEGKEELELDSFNGISFSGFPSAEEFRKMPYVFIDIEKPLWKNDYEKDVLEQLKLLKKQEIKYQKKQQLEITVEEKDEHEARTEKISELEKILTVYADDVGDAALHTPRFSADISFVITHWKTGEKEYDELLVLDPDDEMRETEYNGYKIVKFKTEKELVDDLKQKYRERNPVLSFGHNQVYDNTQLKFAADDRKTKFDHAFAGVNPARDFSRSFMQRLRQDLIYFDSMWLANIFFPYLKQRRFGTNLKLEGVAQYLGIDFKKSLTHEELRFVELRRLAGKTPEIRQEAIKQMLNYVTADLRTTMQIIEKIDFLPVLLKIKELLPFSTLSKIAFSTSCMNEWHEYKHFKKNGNLPYHGFKKKEKSDEMGIFKKRWVSSKRSSMKEVGINKAQKGRYEKVNEYYVPVEEWLKELAFNVHPDLRGIYGKSMYEKQETGSHEKHFVLLKYMRELLKEPLTDHYFAIRERNTYLWAMQCLGFDEKTDRKKVDWYFENLEEIVGREKLDSLIGSFKHLKDAFRSIYLALDEKNRRLVMPLVSNIVPVEFPGAFFRDIDLYLLRNNYKSFEQELNPAKKRVLNSFLENFNTFDELCSEIGPKLKYRERDFSESVIENPNQFLYLYVQAVRQDFEKRRFYAKYKMDVDEVTLLMKNGYKKIAEELKTNNAVPIDFMGDYFWAQGNVPGLYPVRKNIENYVLE